MRMRTIKPGFFMSDQLAECSFAARILFAGLWCCADRRGRLEDRPKRIRAEVFPYDPVDINALLEELVNNALIIRYEADGIRCIWLPTFEKHQNANVREIDSVLPPCPVERGVKNHCLENEEHDLENEEHDLENEEHDLENEEHDPENEEHDPDRGEQEQEQEQEHVQEQEQEQGCRGRGREDQPPETLAPVSPSPQTADAVSPPVSQPPQTVVSPPVSPQAVVSPPPNGKPRGDDCPHQGIIALYHEILPTLPRVRVWSKANAADLRARWREDKHRQNLDWWREFFRYVGKSEFLTGQSPGRQRGAFVANLGWLVKASNFAKVLNGNYNHEGLDVFQRAAIDGYRGMHSAGRGEFIDIGAIDVGACESEAGTWTENATGVLF